MTDSRLFRLFLSLAVLAALAGTLTYAVASATNGPFHRSMMAGSGYAMMGTGGRTSDWYLEGSGSVGTIAQARAQAQTFADRLGLKTGEAMQFTNNFYVVLTDQQGKPATEVLVDPQTGDVTLEYGPAMMWNTRYGMMSGTTTTGRGGMMGGGGGMMGGAGMMSGGMMTGMMGSAGGRPSWTPGNVTGPVSAIEARELANTWLAQQGTGLSAGEPDAFPGYFTMETLRNGKIAGMISVNQKSGAVFYHWWHGSFVAMEE